MSARIATRSVLAVVLATSACATQGGDDGGADNLPNRGIAGWKSVGTTEEPFVLTPDALETFGGPSALVVDGEVVVWFHATTDASMTVRRAASPDGEAFGPASDALANARDPSVVRDADGRFWMAFVDGDGLGLASSDDGRVFTRESATNLPVGDEPALVIDGTTFVVFAVVDGAIVRAAAHADRVFGTSVLVLRPNDACADAFGKAVPCWDETALGGPDVRLATTATGRSVWRMFFAGRRGATFDLGFAASFDGFTFTRYAFDPIVEQAFSQEAPSAVVFPDGYGLYWSEPRTATFGGIVLGRTPPSHPAERW